ncbi:uncharacterized protein BYT42DRAFT_571124 [Radiomyces spectabilis]|uniref:uncharacterized protein n=1 Tax=Radiomyces spectabilis TaxID=64574 RepID=UPI00221F5A9C|nr:uncharacterized protein BYT42DRAFT_571124 [Radiomyces spectabilis]KAI8377653.1 hypothetical protein BYT42DRAFT_571124 [Radiomyces spectabilis]
MPFYLEAKRRGSKVQYDDIIRLKHIGTGRYLHSHYIPSFIYGQHEVSAFSNGERHEDTKWRFLGRHLSFLNVMPSYSLALCASTV